MKKKKLKGKYKELKQLNRELRIEKIVLRREIEQLKEKIRDLSFENENLVNELFYSKQLSESLKTEAFKAMYEDMYEEGVLGCSEETEGFIDGKQNS